jgi:L-serine dehydratase
MNVFDVIGPVMVGPSSSHTAGAVRIGNVTRNLLGEPPQAATVLFHGSFAATGAGHGTHKAVVAGLLGMKPDDMNIPNSFEIARETGLSVRIGTVTLRGVHPNTALLKVRGASGREIEVVASSLGGGRISVVRLDGIATDFSGRCPTLVVRNEDKPGHIAAITGILSRRGINIATMQIYRNMRGGYAVMVIECDEQIPAEVLQIIKKVKGIISVTFLNTEEER